MKLQLPNDTLHIAAGHWNAIPMAPVEGSNHSFYEVCVDGRPCIMRMTNAGYRDLSAVLAELHWINFLSAKMPVARPLLSSDNRVAIPVEMDGRTMIVCLFEKIGGLRLREEEAWGPAIFKAWGKTMSTLHSHSRQYRAGTHDHRQLDGNCLIGLAEKEMGKNSATFAMLNGKWKTLQSIPANEWGMIHGDLTQANMHFFNNILYLFDFDNCQYAPYIYDVAVTVYVTLFSIWRQPGFESKASEFLEHFFEGYGQPGMDACLLRELLDFFNALVHLACGKRKDHPFMEYTLYNLKHGTLQGIRLESFVN
jgi:Ser/Thr protein kinase RdoA (MazF antagonist)